jgi:hypothetical protein
MKSFRLRKTGFGAELTSSFAQVFSAESRVSRSCVCFGFLGLALFFHAPQFWESESELFQLLRVNRELALRYTLQIKHDCHT